MSKILVICFSSINNVAMAIPVIHSLATQYAQHQIMVLSIDTFSPLFENVPDNVIFRGADFRGEHAGLMGLGWLYNDLKEEKFDAVAAFQPTFRSRFLCWRFRLAGIKAAHIKQNRRELQKLIRRKHKIYTEQDSFFQRCAHTLNQIGYPIRLSFLSLFGKNKGNISSLAPLTGEKNQETWIGIAPFATHGYGFPHVLPQQYPDSFLPISPPSGVSTIIIPNAGTAPHCRHYNRDNFSIQFPPHHNSPHQYDQSRWLQ